VCHLYYWATIFLLNRFIGIYKLGIFNNIYIVNIKNASNMSVENLLNYYYNIICKFQNIITVCTVYNS